MTEELRCPFCTHDEFRAITDINDERRVMCLGCDGLHTLDELEGPHGIDEVCVMTPHVVTEIEDDMTVTDVITNDLPDETRQQGYHREVAYIRCECGEQFDRRSDYEDHLE